MRSSRNYSLAFLLLLVLSACNSGSRPIDYGNDGCRYCKMTIVDKIHGAQLVTAKGKVFNFDATECMVNYIKDDKELQIGNVLTNFYETPTAFITTEEATFLISENLPSPMGANLTAFQNKSTAEEMKTNKGGELYDWEALKMYLRN
tara:strand:- start:32449 stop:32889 length:441 start_codon:yes stop_codon:yes gene_type:complete